MVHSMPCRNPCRLLHPSCIHILSWSLKRTVKRTWTSSAFSTNERAWRVMVSDSQSCVCSGLKDKRQWVATRICNCLSSRTWKSKSTFDWCILFSWQLTDLFYFHPPPQKKQRMAVSYRWIGWVWDVTGWSSRLQDSYQEFYRNS